MKGSQSFSISRELLCFASPAKSQLQVVHEQPPNPSIERTSPGKPGAASHVKR
jgi:hypothetical protein